MKNWHLIVINILIIVFMLFSISYLIKKDNQVIEYLQEKNIELQNEKFILLDKIHSLQKTNARIIEAKINNANRINDVKITAYSANERQTDSTPNETALLDKPIPGWTCAVSRDLIHLLGRKIYIEGRGIFLVNDVMNSRHKKRIDICLGTEERAFAFGVKKANVVILPRNFKIER